jgi:serine/threonine protein phosphatase PrpC
MRSAVLNGRDFNELGAIELVGEGSCAIAISRGGAAKTYSHTEPNEDACLFAFGPCGALLAVADGHHGAMGAEIAMRHLLEHQAPNWVEAGAKTSPQLADEASEALTAINLAILAEAERCKLPPSPTTLCIALVRPEEDLLLHASVGDSHIFLTRESAPVDVGWAASNQPPPAYMGYPPTPEREARRKITCEPLTGTRSLVLVTDGFSEEGIGHPLPETELEAIQIRSLSSREELRPVETCRGVAESTVSIQRKHRAGDNLACAVWTAS